MVETSLFQIAASKSRDNEAQTQRFHRDFSVHHRAFAHPRHVRE
jgi:hypothetical protein